MKRFFALAAVLVFSLPLAAQRQYTTQDYSNAERWMGYSLFGATQHRINGEEYLPDGRIFYLDPGTNGTMYMLADPAKGTIAPAFDNDQLTESLRTASGKPFTARTLGVSNYKPDANGFTIDTAGGVFHCSARSTECAEVKPPEPAPQVPQKPGAQKPSAPRPTPTARRPHGSENESPDKKYAAFIRDWNLWVRDTATGEERQLTTDGVTDFGYSTDNAGWQHTDAAILTWSADSKKIATFQLDQRKTGMMYLVSVTNRHPELEAWHYPLVGDKDVTTIQPVILDVATGKMTRLQTPPLEHRSMECDDVSCDGDGKWNDVIFSPDNAHLAFVSTSRDHKDEFVKMADTATGVVYEIFHEHVPTYYGWQSKTDWKYLPGSNEFLWVSERTNWAQIYLYDLTTGKLKSEVTHGDGPVSDIISVDEKARVVYFTAKGKEKGIDPYFDMLYRASFDGKEQKLISPENATHNITASPDSKTFVDSYSTVETPAITVVRDANGKVLLTLGHQDASALLARGWKPPTPITVRSRDPKVMLYGFLWRPTNFDASKKYPVVDYVYPGPQEGSCHGRGFNTSSGDNQALADLGFVVVCIDGQGNPDRSKAFHDAHASKPEDMGDDTIPDQVAGIKDLAANNVWIDGTRVGIWGHSGGGNATVSAMFHFPGFFSVGWAESGNHDNRDYEDDWDERWAGLEVISADGKTDNYAAQANENYAKDLQGHLMLAHGTSDDNVPPSNTLGVVDALIKANRNFDLLMIPNAHHGYGEATSYVTRRRWDYFVKYLAGGTPPVNYQMKTYEEIIKDYYANGPSDEASQAALYP